MEPERTAEERAEAKERHAMALRGIVARLDGELGHHFTRDTIEHYVDDSYDRLSASSRVLTHIPAFVERFARQRLRALARSSGIIEGHPVHVLFVCDRNDGASQMAAALFQAAVGDRGVAHSGGARPAAALLDEAVYALQEVGLDLVGEFPKPVTPEIEAAADVVVTIGDHDDVPVVDGRRYVAWRMPPIDPADPLAYRGLREELHTRVTALVAEVVPPQMVRAFDRELAALETELSSMGDTVIAMLETLAGAHDETPTVALPAVVASDDTVDAAYLRIEQATIDLIARRQPVAGDLRRIVSVLGTALHLERIADGAVEVATLLGEGPELPEGMDERRRQMAALVVDLTTTALQSLTDRDPEAARSVAAIDRSLDALQAETLEALVVAEVPAAGLRGVLLADRIARTLERAGDHAVDIAEDAHFLATGEWQEFRA
jgi:phosphate transport system regulatory protein PhoU